METNEQTNTDNSKLNNGNKSLEVISIQTKDKLQKIIQDVKKEENLQFGDKEYLIEIQGVMHYIKYSEDIYWSDKRQYSDGNELRIYSDWIIKKYKLEKHKAILFIYVDNNNNNLKSIYYNKKNGFFHKNCNSKGEVKLEDLESIKNKM